MPDILDHAPSPKSHVKTLRRIGYTLESAVADIIDNSITADAKNISIYAPPGLENPFISIMDNGCGMSPQELTDNMRIGCKDPDEARRAGDLGRFGSGLKTASFSQARRLTVISKKKGHPIAAARWDIDRIEQTDSWCLEVYSNSEVEEIDGLAPDFSKQYGTQIIWDKLTCIDSGSHAKDADTELAAKLSELKSYIALHFHRFMVGQDKREFSLNKQGILPIDPFMTAEPGYQEGPSEKMRCRGGHIVIQTHVLPHFKNMDSQRLEELGGADGINRKQGLYIYRERRLIHAGGWLGMARSTQLGALARVQVDIPSSLDNEWSTDVKKASLQIPPRVKRELKRFLADPVKRSKKTHTYRGKLDTANKYWKVCEDEDTNVITYQVDPENKLLEALLEKCESDEKRKLIEYLKQLAANLPINHIYEKMSDKPLEINQEAENMKLLEALIRNIV